MIECTLCHAKECKSIYFNPLRRGSFGKVTQQKYHVWFCQNCGVHFLEDILPGDYYDSPQYREEYNDTLDVSKFYQEYDANDTQKIAKIGLHAFRDKSVADFGTAGGTFLQALHGVAKMTIAIEPSKHFHPTLQKTNTHVFSYGKELCQSGIKIDVATSFDVIEHVSDPVTYLREIYDALESGAKLYLKTPNHEDIIHAMIPEAYDAFNYRTAHLFYFNKTSLHYALQKAGFKEFSISYVHDYDLSNLLFWLKEQRPTGLAKSDIFDDSFTVMYKNYLQSKGLASHLWVEAMR